MLVFMCSTHAHLFKILTVCFFSLKWHCWTRKSVRKQQQRSKKLWIYQMLHTYEMACYVYQPQAFMIICFIHWVWREKLKIRIYIFKQKCVNINLEVASHLCAIKTGASVLYSCWGVRYNIRTVVMMERLQCITVNPYEEGCPWK